MALRYNGITIGKICVKQDVPDGPIYRERKFNVQIRQGNCLAVLLYVRRSTPEELEKHPKGKWYHQLWTFFLDAQHMKNIIKNEGDVFYGEKIVSIELNMYYKECWTLLKYFTKSGHKVKCYYKEQKQK